MLGARIAVGSLLFPDQLDEPQLGGIAIQNLRARIQDRVRRRILCTHVEGKPLREVHQKFHPRARDDGEKD